MRVLRYLAFRYILSKIWGFWERGRKGRRSLLKWHRGKNTLREILNGALRPLRDSEAAALRQRQSSVINRQMVRSLFKVEKCVLL